MKLTVGILSSREIEQIHGSALKILERVGMRLPDEEACDLLSAAGAEVGSDHVVKMPGDLVESSISLAPRREGFTLFGRDPGHDFRFDRDGPSLASMTMAVSVIDPESGKKRPATNQDLAALTRLTDSLEHIGVNGGLVTPQEVPAKVNDWYTWATCLKNTSKHITGGVLGSRGVIDAIKMASLAVGGEERFRARPFISGWVLTLPPLGLDRDSLTALIEMARQKMPVILSSGPILGTTSPVTIAGTLAQAHAEIMAGMTVAQVASAGAPVVYTSFARGTDMRSGAISMACPEFALLKVGMAQMGHHLGLPVRMPALLRDSKLLDAQAGFETGMVGGMSAPVADLMDSMQLDMDMVVDYADPVFCNEAMAALKRLCRKAGVDDESLALDIIEQVGPAGSFLTTPHTFQNFRNELWHPDLFERRTWDFWERDGRKDIRQKAFEAASEFLAGEHETLLSPQTESAIDEVVEAARRDYAA